MAKERGRMAPNVFHSVNAGCFDGRGELVDFEGLRFADGKLSLPREIEVTREGNRFRVTWREERDWSTAARGDVMRVGVLYDTLKGSPRCALEVKGVRGELQGEFVLDESMGRGAHVYVFFARADLSAFSSCRYLRVEY